MLRRLVALVLLSLVTTAVACNDDSSSGGSGPGLSPSNQRSSACLEFQAAECDLLADKCQKVARKDCDADFQSLFCKSDADAQACTEALRAATCADDTPQPCVGLADLDAARSACAAVFASLCAANATCTGEDQAACQKQLEAQVCAGAVGVTPSASDCVAAAPSGCAGGKYSIPEACDGVVKTASETTSLPFDVPGLDRIARRDVQRAATLPSAARRVFPRSVAAP